MVRDHQQLAAGYGTSLYVHVPFCVVKCGYCDFNSYVVAEGAAHDRFLDALQAELRRRWRGSQPVSVFFGGGTPSLLSPERLQRLLEIVAEQVDLAGCAEVSMEANPESFTLEKAQIARAAGVNRISIGTQSFHAHHLQFLDRAHDAALRRNGLVRAADGPRNLGSVEASSAGASMRRRRESCRWGPARRS